MATLRDILRAALSLGVRDRARLAQELLASLDAVSAEDAERLWADEAERRLAEFRAGRISAVPADEVAQKARRLLR
jgi:putative addiction module component (TIGR02574 family)